MTRSAPLARACVAGLAIGLAAGLAQADQGDVQAPPVATLPPVNVIGAAPLPGLDLPSDRVPAPVQSATGAELSRSGALTLGDFLGRRFGSVHVNEIQGNPFQPDISYRGYTASPLLGTPQGLSVYVDGIRFNQPFGDVVSWDLIPKTAIASIALMPGSNPLFGLNTLGGALAVQTKDGATHPGTVAQLSGGGYGRVQAEFESGGSDGTGFDWYGAANLFRESGWRDDSPSRVGQAFAKLGWHSGATRATLTASAAASDLHGNGLQEQQLLAQRYAGVYTVPDITRNRAGLLSIAATHELDERWRASGNAYVRGIRTRTLNGDVNDDSLDQEVYALSLADMSALRAAGIPFPASIDPANTPFPSLRCIAQALQQAEPGLACNGLVNRSSSTQTNAGAGVQLAGHVPAGVVTHDLVVGAALDASRTRFSQTTELGYLNADRSVTGVGAFADGRSGGTVDGQPLDTGVRLKARTTTWSVFGADTVSLGNGWVVTGAARYNRVVVANRDELRSPPDPASLDGDQVFARLNPAIGLNWNPAATLHFYAGYNEGSRAPTAIELGCANPDQPCKLPNALTGDPPLHQVVTHTIEAGVRGEPWGGTTLRGGVFRADNHDDLLFIASDASGFGYFRNVGKTRRQGIELGATTKSGPFRVDFAWTMLDARFRSRELMRGSGNSSNDAGPGRDGNIVVEPGDRLPLAPRQIFKAALGIEPTAKTTLDLDLVASAGSLARGNENGQHRADGVFYLGPGRSAGYAVLNLGASVQPRPGLTFFARVGNVLDRRYATAAQLGPTAFDGSGRFVARPFAPDAQGNYPLRGSTFFAPGAPRLFVVGLRYSLD